MCTSSIINILKGDLVGLNCAFQLYFSRIIHASVGGGVNFNYVNRARTTNFLARITRIARFVCARLAVGQLIALASMRASVVLPTPWAGE